MEANEVPPPPQGSRGRLTTLHEWCTREVTTEDGEDPACYETDRISEKALELELEGWPGKGGVVRGQKQHAGKASDAVMELHDAGSDMADVQCVEWKG